MHSALCRQGSSKTRRKAQIRAYSSSICKVSPLSRSPEHELVAYVLLQEMQE